MDKITCNFTKAVDLRPILSLPQPTLDTLVEECQIVCLLTYGTGNPDLAGVGVGYSLSFLNIFMILYISSQKKKTPPSANISIDPFVT